MAAGFIERIIPAGARRAIAAARRRHEQQQYRTQDDALMQCGDYVLEAPAGHLVFTLQDAQPLRDRCVGVTAACLAAKYPGAPMVDIGANIGDTAAMIATHGGGRIPLALIEASPYFYAYLERNVQRLPGDISIRKAFVADGNTLVGTLHHWLGTSHFTKDGADEIPTVTLDEVAPDRTCFVKTDTDGADYKILQAAGDWLAEHTPAVLTEVMLRSPADQRGAADTVEMFHRLGYRRFLIWDDPGFLMLHTDRPSAVLDLCGYVAASLANADGHSDRPVPIHNLDLLALHERDAEIGDSVAAWFYAAQGQAFLRRTAPPAV